MTGATLNNLFRVFTAEPNNQGRWSDADAYTLINEAQNLLGLLLEWPVVNLTATSQAQTQEYVLSTNIQKIERVYLQGQPCVPTDIATLEGTQIEYYDQNSNTTPYTPQWNTAIYNTYPVTNTQTGYPNGVSPYYVGKRPSYYVYGETGNAGNLTMGFVPIPLSSNYAISIWGIGVPNPVLQATDNSDFPSFFASAIAHKASELAFLADSQNERAQAAALKFAEWLPQLRTWKLDLLKNKSRGPRPIAYRQFFKRDT